MVGFFIDVVDVDTTRTSIIVIVVVGVVVETTLT